VQRDSRTDVERLARLLTGRAVGLVLGGGGARGFAHIGVIRAMHEAGIPIDLVGGTSVGACIGAQYAMGLEWPAMLELNRKGFINLNPMADYTLPIVALLNAAKFRKMYHMMFGETQIEDLWLKYYCVSSNLTRGQAVVHEQGPVRKYVRASMSVPGVAPPVPDNGCLLVDGGVLNNLPVDVMRRMSGGGYVIAVDVNPRVELAASVDYGESLSGWSAAWRQLNPLGPRLRLPTIQAILERTTSLSSVQQADLANGLVDLYLHPPIEGFGMFEVAALDRIADVGYRWAQAKLAEWKHGRSF
jgi:predicted acylesterase/phospholipase RssA